jgi:hypothetical protein
MTDRESILQALFARLQTIADTTVLRNEALPERIPDDGLIILRDGDPGEPETLLSPAVLLLAAPRARGSCRSKRRSGRARSRARWSVSQDFPRHRGRSHAWRTLRPCYAASAGQQCAGGRGIAPDQRRNYSRRTYLRHRRSAWLVCQVRRAADF